MPINFEELDYQQTPLGELVLRRRQALALGGREVFEVKLNDEYLMSSMFHEAEVALADLGLAALTGEGWDVAVGGLGLGYTAAAALKYDQVARMIVVEALAPVIEWHQREIVPNGGLLSEDARCRYYHEDFFALARGDGFDPDEAGHSFDAILLDIDHTPDALLNPGHADLYSEAGMRRLRKFLKPGGVFGLWSNDVPEDHFLAILSRVFDQVDGHVVEFDNPIQGNTASNGVYVAKVVDFQGSP
ncbi:MAG: spermidine synthase [Deltaproteobacteria bacterium]|nr:spermidine synthase [Deltaproteobacteria bacterium]